MDDITIAPSGGGGRRRLPTWMLGVAAADKVRKSEEENQHVNNQHENLNKGIASKPRRPKSKPKASAKRLEKEGCPPNEEDEPSEVDTSSLARCGTKRQRRKSTTEDAAVVTDSEVHKTVIVAEKQKKGGRNLRGGASHKRTKDSLRSESSDDIETPSPGDEDGDLTLEDLMSIAQEYVQTDEHKEQQRPSRKGQEVERQLSAIGFSKNESGVLSGASQTSRELTTCEKTLSVQKSTETLAGEGTAVIPTRTGDPAQDMLNLFLGPLLKKPPGEEKKIDLLKEDMEFAHGIKKQMQSNVAVEEPPPVTKKKSSLKDKVAIFLD